MVLSRRNIQDCASPGTSLQLAFSAGSQHHRRLQWARSVVVHSRHDLTKTGFVREGSRCHQAPLPSLQAATTDGRLRVGTAHCLEIKIPIKQVVWVPLSFRQGHLCQDQERSWTRRVPSSKRE